MKQVTIVELSGSENNLEVAVNYVYYQYNTLPIYGIHDLMGTIIYF